MLLIHLLSNHFLRRSMSRLSRIGAAYAAVCAVSWGTSPGTPLTRICH
jgi:phage tail sheath gpL-like